MKGRKPKYPQEEINRVAARLAAGERPSALSKELGWPRTSIIRCADSARTPGHLSEQVKQNTTDKKSAQREQLFWRFVVANLRQGVKKAASAAPKELAAMLDSAVKLRALMASSSSGARAPVVRFADETIMRFERFIKAERVEARPDFSGQAASLGGAKADALESPAEGTPSDVTAEPEAS